MSWTSARNGGWFFPFDPDRSATEAPALWAPDMAPMILPVVPVPAALPGIACLDYDTRLMTLMNRRVGNDRHKVIGLHGRRHRLWFPDGARRKGPFVIALAAGPDAMLSLVAAERLIRAVQEKPRRATSRFRLTPNQRHRLALWLAVLDARELGRTAREIACNIVYPRMERLRGAAWTGSSERRQTYRLIDEAQAVLAGTYRSLLRGEFPKL